VRHVFALFISIRPFLQGSFDCDRALLQGSFVGLFCGSIDDSFSVEETRHVRHILALFISIILFCRALL